MRGAPHKGFSTLICRINARSSLSIGGRPTRRRDFHRQIPTKACAVPTNKTIGANDQKGSEDRREQPIEPDKEKAVTVREPDAAAQLAPQHDELLPERRVPRLKRCLRSKRRG